MVQPYPTGQVVHNPNDYLLFLQDQRNHVFNVLAQVLAEKKYLEEYVKELEDKLAKLETSNE